MLARVRKTELQNSVFASMEYITQLWKRFHKFRPQTFLCIRIITARYVIAQHLHIVIALLSAIPYVTRYSSVFLRSSRGVLICDQSVVEI